MNTMNPDTMTPGQILFVGLALVVVWFAFHVFDVLCDYYSEKAEAERVKNHK